MSSEREITDRIRVRIGVHWPGARTDVGDDGTVRVRVVDDLWLRLDRPDAPRTPWTAQPVGIVDGRLVQIHSRAYGIGLRADAEPEHVADRFYEEVRFWWAEYDLIATGRA